MIKMPVLPGAALLAIGLAGCAGHSDSGMMDRVECAACGCAFEVPEARP